MAGVLEERTAHFVLTAMGRGAQEARGWWRWLGRRDYVPMSVRLPSQLDRPIGFAHRGARAHAPENTTEAFDLALRLGATGLESDVWITADRALVLTHDGVVGLRRRPIAALDRGDLSDEIITFPELVGRTPDHIDLSIDVKDDDAWPVLLEALAEVNPARRSRIFLCHPDWQVLAEWRDRDRHVRLIDSTSLKSMDLGPERRAHDLAEAGIDGVNLRQDEWTGGMTTLFHRFERLCFGWDAQHVHVLDGLLRMGIDGVFSDHVDLMMASIDRHRSSETA